MVQSPITASKTTLKDSIKNHFIIWWNFGSQWENVISESEKFAPMRLEPRETVGKFLSTNKNVLGVPSTKMTSNDLFCVHGCIPGLVFCFFLMFSFRNSVSWDLHFFCVLTPFFTSLWEQIVPVVLVAFFVVVVSDLIFWFSWAYFYILSLC